MSYTMVATRAYEEVCELLDKGAKLFVARDAAGRHRIKLKTGPFGFITKRYTLDVIAMEKLRKTYNLDRV